MKEHLLIKEVIVALLSSECYRNYSSCGYRVRHQHEASQYLRILFMRKWEVMDFKAHLQNEIDELSEFSRGGSTSGSNTPG